MIQPGYLNHYEGKHILVTGSSGYLANNLIQQLQSVHCSITRVSQTGKLLTLNEGKSQVRDVIGPLTDPSFWDPLLEDIDLVFHFAGQANVNQANSHPIQDIQQSILPLLQLLEVCRIREFHPHVVLASSVSLYGYGEKVINENDSDNPYNIYALHKKHAEDYLFYYTQHGWVTGCSLRLTNVYGPSLHLTPHSQGLINQAIYAGFQRKPLVIRHSIQDSRDYLYLDDASRAFLMAGTVPERVNHQTYIIGSGKSYTVQEIIQRVDSQLQRLRGLKLVTENNLSPHLPTLFSTDTQAFHKIAGWTPTISIEEGIPLTIQAQ